MPAPVERRAALILVAVMVIELQVPYVGLAAFLVSVNSAPVLGRGDACLLAPQSYLVRSCWLSSSAFGLEGGGGWGLVGTDL